jgi:hypothetical protein
MMRVSMDMVYFPNNMENVFMDMLHVPRDIITVSHDTLRLHGHDICPLGHGKNTFGHSKCLTGNCIYIIWNGKHCKCPVWYVEVSLDTT